MTTYVLVAACVVSLAVLLYLRQVDKRPQQRAAETRAAAKTDQNQIRNAKIEKTAPGGGRPEAAVTMQPPPSRTAVPPKITPPRTNSAPAVRRAPSVPASTSSPEAVEPARSKKPLPKKSKKAATKAVLDGNKNTAGKTPDPSAGKPPAAPRSEESPQYSRLQNSTLILQAIAWAPEPAKRIAVINGSVVREGETLEGFTLMRIRKDDIVLNDGSKTWQLAFGLKR